MKSWKNVSIPPTARIKDAIEAIEKGSVQICLVADDEDHLIGTITDGDVRRGILRGLDLSAPVTEIVNTTPTHAREGENPERILEVMQRRFLNQIPVLDAEGRIKELLLNPILSPSKVKDTVVVLMAGGLGTRLRPLTEECPKPMLHVGDRPILQRILEQLADFGFAKFVISVNYKADVITSYFGDGSSFGVDITYLHETKRLGTAGALGLMVEHPESPVIVMNGDLLTKVNFPQLLDFHIQSGSMATMCVRQYDIEVPYGVVHIEGNTLLGIEEKPMHSFFINAGMYVLDPKVLEMIPSDQEYDMTTLFEAIIAKGHTTTAFPVREYWMDVGRVDDLRRAQFDFSSC